MQGMGIAMIDHLMMQHGQINMTAEPEIQQERDNFLVVDGHRGLGQYTMTWTMNKAIEKAKKQTFAIGLVHDWHDIGCASAYTKLALDHDCIGILSVNSVTQTAPWGGRELKIIGTALSYCSRRQSRAHHRRHLGIWHLRDLFIRSGFSREKAGHSQYC